MFRFRAFPCLTSALHVPFLQSVYTYRMVHISRPYLHHYINSASFFFIRWVISFIIISFLKGNAENRIQTLSPCVYNPIHCSLQPIPPPTYWRFRDLNAMRVHSQSFSLQYSVQPKVAQRWRGRGGKILKILGEKFSLTFSTLNRYLSLKTWIKKKILFQKMHKGDPELRVLHWNMVI